MSFTLTQAAKVCGRAKSTVLEAIQHGRMSAPKDDRGRYAIDPAELHRVFPFQVSDRTGELEPTPGRFPTRNRTPARSRPTERALEREVELLRERLEEAQAEAERWRGEADRWHVMAERQQALLEDRRPREPEGPASKPRGLLRRLLGQQLATFGQQLATWRMEPLPHPYDKLSWSAPAEERQAAIAELLAHPDRLDPGLLLRSGRKDVQEHAAAVLERINFPQLEGHLPALLEWLQDLNWPGAREVLRLLAQADPAVVRPQLGKAMTRASQERNSDWLENLGQLAEMMGEPGQDLRA